MKNLVIWILFIVVVLVSIWGIPGALKYFMNTDEPMMTVTSHSMWPVLNRGDLIFIKAVEPEDIEVGQVIVFRHGDGLSVHRVVNKGEWLITTKGDANLNTDNPIYYKDVVGRVPAIGNWLVKIPWVGNIAFFMNPKTEVSQDGEPAPEPVGILELMGRYLANPIGFSLLILLPAVMLFSSVIGDILCILNPRLKRIRQRQQRAERLEKRWGKDRARRNLNVNSGLLMLLK